MGYKALSSQIFMGLLFILVAISLPAGQAVADDGALPEGWFPVGHGPSGYITEVSADAGVDGRGLRIKSREGIEATFGGVGQRISADDYIGSRVRLSGYVRSMDVDQTAGLWMRVDPASGGQPLAFDNMHERAIKGTSDWQRYEVVLDITEDAGYIFFGALLTGKGEIHVDRLDISIVDDDVETTDMLADMQ